MKGRYMSIINNVSGTVRLVNGKSSIIYPLLTQDPTRGVNIDCVVNQPMNLNERASIEPTGITIPIGPPNKIENVTVTGIKTGNKVIYTMISDNPNSTTTINVVVSEYKTVYSRIGLVNLNVALAGGKAVVTYTLHNSEPHNDHYVDITLNGRLHNSLVVKIPGKDITTGPDRLGTVKLIQPVGVITRKARVPITYQWSNWGANYADSVVSVTIGHKDRATGYHHSLIGVTGNGTATFDAPNYAYAANLPTIIIRLVGPGGVNVVSRCRII